MYMPYDQLPDPTDKFSLGQEIGVGFAAKVYKAQDLDNDRTVAIKIQRYDKEHEIHIEEEYHVLRDNSTFPNIPDFYGAYRKRNTGAADEIWFVMQYCAGGTAVEMVNKLLQQDRRMKEEHIAFIIKETAKAVVELNRNHFIHRDIRGSNILLTKEGEVKLCDFNLTREVDSTFGKRGTCIGSPCWMAPEMVTAQDKRDSEIYDSRSDVWALAITAIELADGKPPFFDMHPTRAMFQIVRNPPPTLFKPSNWSQNFNDFITECLEKNPENRAHMLEVIEHPFLNETFENEFAMQQEIKHLLEVASGSSYYRPEEILVDRGYVKKYNSPPEKMYSEDLAAIENPIDEIVLDTLKKRLEQGQSYTFIGDILLSLNSNDLSSEFEPSFHEKYKFKSRSENSPHIFSVADLAYQDMMHHKIPQHVTFAGETFSGKTTNVKLFVKHLSFLGGGNKGATERVQKSMKSIQMLVNAGTPVNNDSTRCNMQYHVTFGTTGKMSGCVFLINLLEKNRVSSTDMNQHNFHIIYYFYDYIIAHNKAGEYFLDTDRNYRYMRIPPEHHETKLKYCRDDPQGNIKKFEEFENILLDLDMSRKNLETVRKMLAAILSIGNLRFKQSETKMAEIEDAEVVTKIADLLRVDEKKFQWSLTQYIKVKGGIAERRQYTAEAARDARDALAATIYSRLVDWIINKINMNLAFPRAVFGDSNVIVVYDMFGFECFHRNGLEQLLINTLNEQMQYHYNQKIFAMEMFEQEADGVPAINLNFYDNKQTLDSLLTKPEGLFYQMDNATKENTGYEGIIDNLVEKRSTFVKAHSGHEISIAHFTGKIIYDIRSVVEYNRDFVPPEMIESLRTSLDESIVLMFTNQLSRTGNLTMAFEGMETQSQKDDPKKKTYNLNTLSQGQYSQATNLRTISAQFRCVCLEMLKALSQQQDIGSHFVRCVRADLEYKPRSFHPDMVQQQIKALGVLDTMIARQQGYSCRISFQECLKRYQFLAFDFDETVDITKENCRLLLIRLKMEGWAIGKSKVFLRYYNDEFLSRLYEVQVKKIIKVQSMMRALISRRKMAQKNNPSAAYRGFKVRQKYGPLLNEKTGIIDSVTADFLRGYARKWKSKSIFQVLLHYRAARFQDLVNISQQVHFFNQRIVAILIQSSRCISLEKVDRRQNNSSLFGPLPMPTRKLPFRLSEIPYFDTTYMCDPVNPLSRTNIKIVDEEEERWDSPLQRNPSLTAYLMTYNAYKKEQSCQTNWDRLYESDNVYNQSFMRDPKMMNRRSNMSQNTSNIYNDYNNQNYINNFSQNSNSYQQNNRGNVQNQGLGSRRNSLKTYAAPPPPPMNKKNDDASFMNRRQNANNFATRDYRPSNPVRELQMIARGSNMENDRDDPPFNFKSMLRKTNYSRPEDNNFEYNSRSNESSSFSSSFAAPKLKSTGINKTEVYNNYNSTKSSEKKMTTSYNETSSASNTVSNENNSTSSKSGNDYQSQYVEAEIAPGVTLSGYAINI